jgi:hypothetical protein
MASIAVLCMRRGAPSALANRGSQWPLWSEGAGEGIVVSGGLSLVQTHATTGEGRCVWCPDAWRDDPPVGAGDARGGRRASGGSPHCRARASGGPPRCDQWASGEQAGLVMGRSDQRGDRVCGAAVARWPRGPRAVGEDVCRHPGDRALEGLQLVSGAVAAALWGALVTGLCSDARPWGPRRGEG